MLLLKASSLVKEFQRLDNRPLAALGPLDLEINAGEFVCILGPSGCGKSTLLRIVAGLDEPTSGRLEINGEPVAAQQVSNEGRPFNSMVFQGDSTFPWLTVYDNVDYGLRVRNVPFKEREAIVRKMLRTVGLTGFADAYPYQLSGGMRQRVALARALANDPHLLLMDEPFGALDAQNRDLLQDELLQIWEQTAAEGSRVSGVESKSKQRKSPGTTTLDRINESADAAGRAVQNAKKTILFVTHSIEEAIVLGDRVIVFSAAPGQVKADIHVPFPRPRRTYELRREPSFGELVYQIWETLRDEVNAARAAEQHV